MTVDMQKTRFEAVEICGVQGLFTVERVRRSALPNGIYAYDMQTSPEDWSQPCLLACHITVEHYGTVLTGQRIDLPENGTWHRATSTGRALKTDLPLRNLPGGMGCQLSPAAMESRHRHGRDGQRRSALSTQAWHLVAQMPLVRGAAPKTPKARIASQIETHFL